jgi:hypothetical protein
MIKVLRHVIVLAGCFAVGAHKLVAHRLAFGRREGVLSAVKDAATAGKSCLVEGQDWSGFNGELIEGEKYSGAWLTTTAYFDKVDSGRSEVAIYQGLKLTRPSYPPI